MAHQRGRRRRARRGLVQLLEVPHHRPLLRGHVRELGERVPPDGRLRPAHRVPRPEGLAESKRPARRPRRRGPPRHRRRPGRPWPVRRGGIWLASTRTRCSSRSPCCSSPRSCGHAISGAHSTPPSSMPRAPRSAPGSSCDVRVLVPVVPELAKLETPRRRHDRRAHGVPAPTRSRNPSPSTHRNAKPATTDNPCPRGLRTATGRRGRHPHRRGVSPRAAPSNLSPDVSWRSPA